jgi:CheY-like chemotaxis protein
LAVMSRLKENSKTRHIPVHFISASDMNLDALRMGAVGYITKPVSMEQLDEAYGTIEQVISKTAKNLLLVEDNETQRKAIIELIGNGDIYITSASTGQDAFNQLSSGNFDCVILDLGLPDMSGMELLEKIRNDESIMRVPIIVYTGRDLTKEEKMTLDEYAEKVIIKGAKSPEKLLDETTLFLHRIEADLPEHQRQMLQMIHDKESILKDKNVLLADDDMRNVFAITNTLEEKGMNVLVAKNGIEALECLDSRPDVDLVLMDIMMPEMDGYEAIREIRKKDNLQKLPIIALTAKAMKGDRSKCIEAGANDYLAKPVDTEKLFSMLRVWLYG